MPRNLHIKGIKAKTMDRIQEEATPPAGALLGMHDHSLHCLHIEKEQQ